MKRTLPLITAVVLAGCSPDPVKPTAPPAGEPRLSAGNGGVVESVTGHAEHTFFGGALLRNTSFSAWRYADGRVKGQFEVTVKTATGTRPVHFEVVCLAVDGNKAWIGGTIVAPKNDPFHGFSDIWYVEDGGKGQPDLVGATLGVPDPNACALRLPPAIPASPSERGELIVRDDVL